MLYVKTGWLTLAPTEYAEEYLLPEDPVKRTMQVRQVSKSFGAAGLVGIGAGAALHSLHWLAARKKKVQEQARFLHAASFVLIDLLLPVHLYLSLIPVNRHGLRAIYRDGKMEVATVRDHHPLWFEQLKREGRL